VARRHAAEVVTYVTNQVDPERWPYPAALAATVMVSLLLWALIWLVVWAALHE
jgi:hypothetical protein